MPKFIGPYTVKEAHNAASTVTLELPEEIMSRHITPTFHASLIRQHITNNDGLFLHCEASSFYDFSADHDDLFPHCEASSFYNFCKDDEQKWLIDEIIAHQWSSPKDLELQIKWTLGDITWDPLAWCKELEALYNYLELQGVTWSCDLPRWSWDVYKSHDHHMIHQRWITSESLHNSNSE